MMEYHIYCKFIWINYHWRRVTTYIDTGSDRKEVKLNFSIHPEYMKSRYRLPNPDLGTAIGLINVDNEHLIITIRDREKSILRPYESFLNESIRMGATSIRIGGLRFPLNETEMTITDSRQFINYH